MPNADLYVGKKNNNNNKRNIREPAYVEVVRKNYGNKVAGLSRDRPLTVKRLFFDVSTKLAKF